MWNSIWTLVLLVASLNEMTYSISILRDAEDTFVDIPDPDKCWSKYKGSLNNKTCKCTAYQPTLMSQDNGSLQCMNSINLGCLMEADQSRSRVFVVPDLIRQETMLDIASYKAQCLPDDTRITAMHLWNMSKDGQTGRWEVLTGQASKYFVLEFVGKYQLLLKVNDDVATHDWTGIIIRVQLKCNNVDNRCMMIKVKGGRSYPVDINDILREPSNAGTSSIASLKTATMPTSISSRPPSLSSLASSTISRSTATTSRPSLSTSAGSSQFVSTLVKTSGVTVWASSRSASLTSASSASSVILASISRPIVTATPPINSVTSDSARLASTLIKASTIAASVSSRSPSPVIATSVRASTSLPQATATPTIHVSRSVFPRPVSTPDLSPTVTLMPGRVTTPAVERKSSTGKSSALPIAVAVLSCALVIVTAAALAYVCRRRLKVCFAGHANKNALPCEVVNNNAQPSEHVYAGVATSLEMKSQPSAIPLVVRNEPHASHSPSKRGLLGNSPACNRSAGLGPPVPQGTERPRFPSSIQRDDRDMVDDCPREEPRYVGLQSPEDSNYAALNSHEDHSDAYTLPVPMIQVPGSTYEGLNTPGRVSRSAHASGSGGSSAGVENSAFDGPDALYLPLAGVSNPTYTSLACADSDPYLLPQPESGALSQDLEVEQVYCELGTIRD